MAEVVLKYFEAKAGYLLVPIETAICLSIIEYTNCSLNIVLLHESKHDAYKVKYNLKGCNLSFKYEKEGYKCMYTMLPSVLTDDISCIAGLAAVLRQIVKASDKRKLLGFRNCCLAAPAETSCWTRFSEVDIVYTLQKLILSEDQQVSSRLQTSTVSNGNPCDKKLQCNGSNNKEKNGLNCNSVSETVSDEQEKNNFICTIKSSNNKAICIQESDKISNPDSYQLKDCISCKNSNNQECMDKNHSKSNSISNSVRELPEELAILEYHLSIPARVHNRGKYGNNGPNHDYVEGPHMVLSDLVIAVCVHLILDFLRVSKMSAIPFIKKWLNRVLNDDNFSINVSRLLNINHYYNKFDSWVLPILENGPVDLYKKEGTRRKRIFTQGDLLSKSLVFIQQVKLMEYSKLFEESDLESIGIILPDVPQDRLDRKVQQLTNLAKAVLQIAKPGDILVDFCCGSGHLGLLLAKHLPSCTIILLDNKETSMERAKQRVQKMGLKNVKIIQSNLDYFTARFQIGMSLHACGVASDLVIRKCLLSKAHLVVCPCCYGAIQSNHMLSYPQSSTFIETGLTEYDFIVLAHNADTYDSDQGRLAMTAVDTDRCLFIKQHGYNVTLSKLQPQDCTTRNNMIVAVSY